MEPWLVAIGSVIALMVAASLAIRDRRALARVRAVAGASLTTDAVFAVGTLRAQTNALEEELAADRHDHDLLIESIAQGVLSVDRGLRIVGANSAAHTFVGRQPGALIGRTLIEAFLDVQVEAIARTAMDQGSADQRAGLTTEERVHGAVRADDPKSPIYR